MREDAKIIYIDLVNTDDGHREFNEGTIKRDLSVGAKKILMHPSNNAMVGSEERFDIKYMPSNLRSAIYRWFIINIIIAVLSYQYRKQKLYFLHLPPLSQLVVCCCSIFMKFPSRIYIHGELMYLIEAKGFGQKIGSAILNLILKENWSGTQKIVLSATILSNLKNILPINQRLCTYEEQRNETLGLEGSGIQRGTSILMTGVISKQKKAHLINFLTDNLNNDSNIKLKVVGKFDNTISESEFNSEIEVINTREMIPQKNFIKMLLTSRALFIPQLFAESYTLIYSGMLETCLKTNTPVITFRTKYLDNLEKKYGRIGILLKNEDELKNIKFGEISEQEWESFSENIQKSNREVLK